ncbi:MAG TPA: NAD(P)H-dependent oxidoreductase [Flavobacteriales bacterium]|mgnify:FL=1|nr:NAD(P)H-dependent oxidoreductase [Flavobacteriales bacterium]
MPRVLVLFAHPRLERSRTNRALLKALPASDRITFRDLYELYPDMQVDVRAEQDLLAAHDVVVLHHPLYWYSVPPLLKQYIDLVYAVGWAYGPGGTALKGRTQFHVVTTGGGADAYSSAGFHGHTLQEFLLPLKRTATLCGMQWAPPFAVQGTHRVDDSELERIAQRYGRLLQGWAEGTLTLEHMSGTTDQHHLLTSAP